MMYEARIIPSPKRHVRCTVRRVAHVLLGCAAMAIGAVSIARAQQPARKGLKVYISADMEGVAGAVSADQLLSTGFEYDKFRGYMTDEVLAAIAGARDAGATTFVVSDSHGNGENLILDRFPADVTIIRSWPRPLGMMEGIDSTFDAVIFIGYHASTSNSAGVRAHTFSSALLTEVGVNGVAMPESGVNASIAGAFGVPVLMISGDNVAVAEAQHLIGPMSGAVVKRAISFEATATMTPAAAQTLIRQTARAALGRRGEVKPFVQKTPVQLDVTFKNYRPAELMTYLPSVTRTSSHGIRFMARDMIELSRFLEFVTSYEPGLTP
jgi:D-amino peptidase